VEKKQKKETEGQDKQHRGGMKTHERQTKKEPITKKKKRQRDQERIGEEPEKKTAQKELTG